MRWLVPVLFTAALVAPGAASAQGKGDAKKADTPAAAKADDHGKPEGAGAHHDKDAKRDGGGGKADDEAHGRRDGGGMPEDVRTKLAEMRQKHAATRAERRKDERAKVKQKWGAAVGDAAVRAELAIHARREARIDAMEDAAKAGEKTALLAKISDLRAKENARHEKKMDQLAKRGDGGAK